MLSESEPASKIVIEAEKGYEVQNFTPVVADQSARTLEDLKSGNTDASLMSGGAILVAHKHAARKRITYVQGEHSGIGKLFDDD